MTSPPTGTPISKVSISKDSTGYSELLEWIVKHMPGPRLAISGEGAGSYVAGLTRAVAAAGLIVIESEQPGHIERCKDQSDPIDANSVALAASHLDADRLLRQQTEGDLDALRILLGARQDLTTTATRQSNRLRALLLSGNDTDRKIARAALTEATLVSLIRRPSPTDMTRQQAVRHAEIRRLALAVAVIGRELKASSTQLQAIVDDLAPGLTDRRGIGPISAAEAIIKLSSIDCPEIRAGTGLSHDRLPTLLISRFRRPQRLAIGVLVRWDIGDTGRTV